MEEHRNLTDDQFEIQFETGTFVLEFTHEAHLRLAWIHVTKYGIDQAVVNISEQILTFARSKGVENTFNKTLTIAAVRIVHHFVQRSKSDDFYELLEEFPRLINNFKGLLTSHYSTDIFANERAKKEYLEPAIPFE